MEPLKLLPDEEIKLRVSLIANNMRHQGIDIGIINDNANIYYLTGRVVSGYIVITSDERAVWFVRRPNHLTGDHLHYIRKPEQIAPLLTDEGIELSGRTIGLEMNTLSVNDFSRLQKALCANSSVTDISAAIRGARSIKTPFEIEQIRYSGQRQEAVYRTIPSLYRPGMTDLELQIEIERALRLAGCLGQFRISGNSMELFMANILCGDNADTPTPYDFAMGGAGANPSLPVGANGTVITPGQTVMVDANGNFNGYMTDMTRTFYLDEISPQALLAHQCSIDICQALSDIARPGVEARRLYELAMEYVAEAGLEDYFMGHRQKAGFVGHGLGIEINEAPVIAPRSTDILAVGNVFALEPKFVIPGTGAVGIENTYVILDDQTVCLTGAPEELLPL